MSDIMTWVEVIALWVVLSICLPLFLGYRYSQFKERRERLRNARLQFHRFHIAHSVSPLTH
jgi:hypothetical protein